MRSFDIYPRINLSVHFRENHTHHFYSYWLLCICILSCFIDSKDFDKKPAVDSNASIDIRKHLIIAYPLLCTSVAINVSFESELR